MIRSNCGLVTKKPPIQRDVPPKKTGAVELSSTRITFPDLG